MNLSAEFQYYYAAHRRGQFAAAEKGYRELLRRHPGWGRVLNALGNLMLDQNRIEDAKEAFESGAALNPPDLSSCYNLGRLKQLENDHPGAIVLYKSMIDMQPDIALAWNNLGVAYREIGQKNDALESFRTAVRCAPEMAEAWNNLGVAQDELDQAENAVYSYRKAIEIQPDYVSPHMNLGISLQKSDKFKEAEEHYRAVLALQSGNEVAEFMLHSIRGDETPESAPVEHVRNIFDQCADNFEAILVDELAYKTPEFLFNLVRPYLTEEMNILDLGCGTGLGARLYRPFARHLTGVDISAKMLEKADEKGIYNRLAVFNALEDWDFPAKFDLIYSSDVFVYFGNLDAVIKSASSYLVNGGLIAFSLKNFRTAPGIIGCSPVVDTRIQQVISEGTWNGMN